MSQEEVTLVQSSEDKYWIAQGIQAKLRGVPDLIVMVDRIIYKTVITKDYQGNQKKRKLVVGVQCHWVDKEHKYQRGLFNTKELIKHEEPEL